jgi:hypothetical protein
MSTAEDRRVCGGGVNERKLLALLLLLLLDTDAEAEGVLAKGS